MHKVFIVEDDPSIVLDFEMILESFQVEICGVSDSVPNAIEELKSMEPDFAIVDIRVKDKMGFDVILELNKRNIPVIVCTGFPNESHLQESLDLKVHSFITKPVVETVLKFEVSKIISNLKPCDYFVFNKTKFEIVKIDCKDIIFFEADGNHTIIQTTHKKHIIRKALSKIYKDLPFDKFSRIHRGIVINIDYVSHVQISKNIVCLNNFEFPIGKVYKSAFLENITKDKIMI